MSVEDLSARKLVRLEERLADLERYLEVVKYRSFRSCSEINLQRKLIMNLMRRLNVSEDEFNGALEEIVADSCGFTHMEMLTEALIYSGMDSEQSMTVAVQAATGKIPEEELKEKYLEDKMVSTYLNKNGDLIG